MADIIPVITKISYDSLNKRKKSNIGITDNMLWYFSVNKTGIVLVYACPNFSLSIWFLINSPEAPGVTINDIPAKYNLIFCFNDSLISNESKNIFWRIERIAIARKWKLKINGIYAILRLANSSEIFCMSDTNEKPV